MGSGTLAPGSLTLDNALNKMLCDPVKDGEASTSLQPWQIYSGLFLGFWAFSAFFDHFLATASFGFTVHYQQVPPGQVDHLGHQGRGGGALVLPGWWQNSLGLVVSGEPVNSAFNQN